MKLCHYNSYTSISEIHVYNSEIRSSDFHVLFHQPCGNVCRKLNDSIWLEQASNLEIRDSRLKLQDPAHTPPLTHKPPSHFQPKSLHRYICLTHKPPYYEIQLFECLSLQNHSYSQYTNYLCHIKAQFVVLLHQTPCEIADIAIVSM